MLEITERPLGHQEKNILEEKLNEVNRKMKFHYRFTFGSLVILTLIIFLIIYFFAASEKPSLLFMALGLVLIYGFSVLWGYKQNKKMFSETEMEINQSLAFNKAKVYKCFAQQCVSFQNKSLDEAAHFFKVQEGKLFFISGFEFYPYERFPNTDFEIVAIKKDQEVTMHYELNCHGIFLKPISILPDKLKSVWRSQKKYPVNLSVIQGNFKDIDAIIPS